MPSPPLTWAWLDGTFIPAAEARVSPFDRGFLFGDGVYEVIPVYGGGPFHLDGHLDRLAHSLSGISLEVPWSREWLAGKIHELVERNGGGDQSLYLQVTRGPENGRDHRFPAHPAPTLFMFTHAAKPRDPAVDGKGLKALSMEDIRWRHCDIKAVSLLANVLLRQHAQDEGADEVILHRGGHLTEASVSNIYLVTGGRVRTPPLGKDLLPGITRIVILDLCRDLGIEVDELPMTLETLSMAEELWISSSTKEIAPITLLDGAPVGDGKPGPVYRRVREAFDRLVGRG